ncbi:MAG: DNA polymerase I [Pirellulaceae bacterium]
MPGRNFQTSLNFNAPGGEKIPAADDRTTESDGPDAISNVLSGVEGLQDAEVWIVDSHSLIFQVFHAIPPMTGPAGQPVAAIYGFCRDMLFLLEKKRPDYLICAFDMPGKTFRHDLYDDYKVHREEMPQELRPQIEGIHRFMEAMTLPVIQRESFEADDVLATLARQVQEAGGRCTLVTTDKDCRQLITEQVQLFNVRKNAYYDAEALLKDWGIRPDQVVDFQSLVGDSVDNVPGIPLIGPKIAKELLLKYETLDNILDHAEEISGNKRRENLVNGREMAHISRDLVRLVNDIPLEIDWDACRVTPINLPACQELCREFGFRTLADQFANLDLGQGSAVAEKLTGIDPASVDYQSVTTLQQLEELVTLLQEQTLLSLDTETTSTNARWADLVGISVAWEVGKARYIPLRAPEGDPVLDQEKCLDILRPVLENPEIGKIGQNLKYDLTVLRSAGINVQGVVFDTMVAHYLLESGARSHGMDELSRRYLGHETVKISELIGTGKNQKKMDEVPLETISFYASEDADIPLRLYPILKERLEEEKLLSLLLDVELPLIEALAELEYNGIKVDVDRLGVLSELYGNRMDRLEAEIHDIAGRPFNIASPKQLAQILFEERGLPIIRKTKTGASTDAEVLEQLAKIDPLPRKIMEYRQYAKLKNTYLDTLPHLINPKTGLVHTSFNQVVAATGRLSSNEPNLQNIPIRTEEGREIRSAFRPSQDDWVLVCADYSQIELRVLAHFSQDEALIEAYRQDQDIHAKVAAEVYEVPLDQVSSSQRRSAKAINFGIVYGQSAFGLAKSLDISKEEAFGFIDAYFKRYPGVDEFMEQTLQKCYEEGYVHTILNRKRKIDGVRSPAKRDRLARQLTMPERTAVNTVIQGSAADIIKLAMLRVRGKLRDCSFPVNVLLQIHDELVFETPKGNVNDLVPIIQAEMMAAAELAVPLVVDIESGPNWAECQPV